MESDYKKYKFSEIFKENLDGSLTPIKPIQINGVTFRSSTSFQKGVAFPDFIHFLALLGVVGINVF